MAQPPLGTPGAGFTPAAPDDDEWTGFAKADLTTLAPGAAPAGSLGAGSAPPDEEWTGFAAAPPVQVPSQKNSLHLPIKSIERHRYI